MAKKPKHPTKTQLAAKRKAIDACRDANGRVMPELVVAAARNPKSPLHSEFPWDDSEAAHLFRLDRARKLIREVRVTVIIDHKRVQAPYYVSDPEIRDSAYIPITVARKSEERKEAILLDELRRIESSIIRARSVAAAFDMVEEFDRMLDTVTAVRGRLRGGPKSSYGEIGQEARA